MYPKIVWPVVGKFPITFPFGSAPDWYIKIFGYPHNGIDIGCPVGTPVLACDNGDVAFSDDIPDVDGKGLILKHEWGLSLYWHLQDLIAKLGNRVEKGVLIGHSGRTGYVTGPHLHFGTKVFGDEVPGMRGWTDPLRYIEETIAQPPAPAPVARWHRVMPGESLWSLAQKYYGDGTEWRRIYLANQEKINNPNLIFPFQKLFIP
jgi:murein DD-endopeptidase MepM/ murein hydrolase activator NlpD